MQGVVRGNAGHPNLQWETITKLNAGVDIALLNERIRITGDVFENKTTNMIVYEPAATYSGLDYTISNGGAMKTTGIEASINVRVVNKNNFKWDFGVNIAHSKSIVTQLPVDKILTEFAGGTILTQVGLAPNVFYGYKSNGVYASNAEAAAAGLSVKNANTSTSAFKGGDVRFANINSADKMIDDNDRTVIGNPNPDFYGAFLNTIVWKKWKLDAVVSFSKGNQIYNYTRRKLEALDGYNNQTEAAVKRWRTDGQMTDMPKATWGDPMGNARFSDRWIEDGSYLRLRTVSLSYNVAVKANSIKSMTVYLTANNLVTITKYLGYDPEFSATSGAIGQGVDAMLEPQYKSVIVGVKIGL
jgi:TonB dependent receptor